MKQDPEPLAAILAEMREEAANDREDSPDSPHNAFADALESYADRIEEAYTREHAEWHAETEAAKDARNRVACRMRSEFAAKCRDCTERAPGNAAAMREALHVAEIILRRCVDEGGYDAQEFSAVATRCSAALSAPARNCDRFATAEEAVAAFADHLRAWENAHGICSEYPDHAVQVPAGAFAWLFGKAEGGAE